MWSRFYFSSHFCPPTSIAQNVFPSPHSSWVTKHPICRQHLIFEVKEQISLPWGITGKPWSLLFVPCLWRYSSSLRICLWALTWPWGWYWAAWLVCAAAKATSHVCSGESDSNPCLVPQTTWLDHAVKRETTGLRQLKPPALLKIQHMQGVNAVNHQQPPLSQQWQIHL